MISFDHDLPSTITWLGFLADDERVTHDKGQVIQKAGGLLTRPANDPESLLKAANLLSLLLFRVGRLEDARHICRLQITYALRHRNDSKWPFFAMAALSSQINLLRVEGYAGSVESALAGLTALEKIAAGEGAELPDLLLHRETVDLMARSGYSVQALVRNVRIAETCKILWRRGEPQRLLAEADHLTHLWPVAVTRGIPYHAEEASWLVTAPEMDSVPLGELDQQPRWLQRLTWIMLLHAAAHAAAHDDSAGAAKIALALHERRHQTAGPYASELTPLRWLASLADTLCRIGAADLGFPLLREVLAHRATASDRVLCQGVRARLGLAEERSAAAQTTAELASLLETLQRQLSR